MSAPGRRDVPKSRKSRGRRAGRIGFLALAVAAAWALVAAVAAQATTVTVGSVMPPTFTSTPFEGVRTQFNTTLPETGANLASPVNGAIVRWKVAGAVGGPFTLRVLHPNGAGAYTATASSQAVTPNGSGIETFSTQLPIRSGDLIFSAPPFEGATNAPAITKSGQEIELSAEVQPAPAVTAVSPDHGSVNGGEKVTITGTNLNGASSVMFGETPATSFTIVNEEKITAIVPQRLKTGNVDIVVTTLAGESPTGRVDQYAYQGCTGPKLAGKQLGSAKVALRVAGCKLGKVSMVKGPAKKTGQVTHQSRPAGKVLAPGATIAIKIVKQTKVVAKKG